MLVHKEVSLFLVIQCSNAEKSTAFEPTQQKYNSHCLLTIRIQQRKRLDSSSPIGVQYTYVYGGWPDVKQNRRKAEKVVHIAFTKVGTASGLLSTRDEAQIG